MITASIITIGDELLIGQVIDTNSAFIAQSLNSIGIPVTRRVAVGDNWDEIWKALEYESSINRLILITGGLGPTADDITKPLLCKYFNGKMVMNEDALQNVIHLFEKRFNRPVTERNRKQAEVPDTCKVLLNTNGTAPGMWFEKNNSIFISLPGVPFEMQSLIREKVTPMLVQKFSLPTIIHKTLITFGVGESMLADLIQDFETSLPNHIKLAYLPNHGIVRLRLSCIDNENCNAEAEINNKFTELQELVAEYLIATDDEPLEKIVASLLKNNQQTLSTAESCTGGYIAHLLSSNAGASSFYNGSIISYSNKCKEDMLFVNQNTLVTHGAVSKATVIEMTKGVLQQLHTDYAIAVSGIMGPDGGSTDKPVGTVWIAVGNKKNIQTNLFHLRFDRSKNIQLTAMYALNMLRQFIIEQSIP